MNCDYKRTNSLNMADNLLIFIIAYTNFLVSTLNIVQKVNQCYFSIFLFFYFSIDHKVKTKTYQYYKKPLILRRDMNCDYEDRTV